MHLDKMLYIDIMGSETGSKALQVNLTGKLPVFCDVLSYRVISPCN